MAPRVRSTGVRKGEEAAAWGWYAATVLPEPKEGGTVEGVVLRNGAPRAFWAVWWSGDPRRAEHPPEPDEYGFVTGNVPLDEAVGAAYDALRKGRGRHVYDICIGETWALSAYREGAPTKKSAATDFDSLAASGRSMLGLGPEARPPEVRAAWRAWARQAHPDRSGVAMDMQAAKHRYEAALAASQRVLADAQRADMAAGKTVVDEDKFLARVRTVAKRVREACEKLFRPLELANYRADTLCGYCTVAAVGLVHALREAGIIADLAAGSCNGAPHWWAEVRTTVHAERTIVDITATQFWKRARVLIAHAGSTQALKYDARSRDISKGALLSVELPPHLSVLFDGLPSCWWRGGGTMTPKQRRELEARVRDAMANPSASPTQLVEFLRKRP